MQQDMYFPKLFLHTTAIIDYQWVTRAFCRNCDKIGISVTKTVTKLSPRIAATVTRTSISLVERKKWLCRSLRKCVAIRWFFHSRKHAYFILKHSKFTRFFLPSRASISPSISSSEDRCLVWLVYLIHEPDRTSNWSFFFNQNTSLHSIVRFRKELTLSRGSFKTMKDWCGNPVSRGYFYFHRTGIIRDEGPLILPAFGYKTRQLPPLSGPSRWMIPSAFSLARCFSMALGVTPMISASFRAE